LKITFFNGKNHYKWPFSIAMLNYQRVLTIIPGFGRRALSHRFKAQRIHLFSTVGPTMGKCAGEIPPVPTSFHHDHHDIPNYLINSGTKQIGMNHVVPHSFSPYSYGFSRFNSPFQQEKLRRSVRRA
jgi:hypothetical protein